MQAWNNDRPTSALTPLIPRAMTMPNVSTTAMNHPSATRRLIERRWEQSWRGLCAIAARKYADPAVQFHAMRELHATRVLACLRADFREVTITKYDLDSPTISSEEFMRDLQWALDRRVTYNVGKRIRKVKVN